MGQHQGRRGGAGKASSAPVPVPASGGPREGAAMEACLDRYHRHIVAKYVPNERPIQATIPPSFCAATACHCLPLLPHR